MKDLALLEKYYKVLSSKKRLHILSLLKKEKSATVSDIADAIHMKKFATSQHLRILRNLDIVSTRKRGSFMTYRLTLKQSPVITQALKFL
ncbi:MAG: metalloregulator ArsR/SmtB family transcription factor [Kiritimatiellales bacterium]|nr:metalloregulator ArsR/SmtB family transcription factor [Kiritimatiellales bacterium]